MCKRKTTCSAPLSFIEERKYSFDTVQNNLAGWKNTVFMVVSLTALFQKVFIMFFFYLPRSCCEIFCFKHHLTVLIVLWGPDSEFQAAPSGLVDQTYSCRT